MQDWILVSFLSLYVLNRLCMILTGMGDVGRAGEDGIGTRYSDHTGVEADMIRCVEC